MSLVVNVFNGGGKIMPSIIDLIIFFFPMWGILLLLLVFLSVTKPSTKKKGGEAK